MNAKNKSNNVTDEIKSKISLSDVVQKYVSWDNKKSNPTRGSYWACCPFHSEKTASFTVDNNKNTYHCFGCNEHGDAFKFLMDIESIDFPEALRRLADLSGITLPEKINYDPIERQKREILYTINDEAKRFFINELNKPENIGALDYILSRGLGKDDMKQFEIGYTAKRGELVGHLTSCGFNDKQIFESGLSAKNDDGKYYERFINRIIFPINDKNGRTVGFGGRDFTNKAPAKYLNSPETELFQKKNIVYNYHNAKRLLGNDNQLIVCEGYFDCIALSVNGYQKSVATMGTSMSQAQIQLLWQLSNLPILCYDGDSAGINAANRVIDIIFPILKPGFSMKFVFLPDGLDPDDLLNKLGKNELNNLIANAVPLIDLFWAYFITTSEYGTPEDRANIENLANRMMDRIESAEVKKQYKFEIRDRLNAYWKSKSFESNRVFFKGTKKKPSSQLLQKFRTISEVNEVTWQDSMFVLVLISYPELVSEFMDEITTIKLLNDNLTNLKEYIIQFIISNKVKNDQSKLVINHLKESNFKELMGLLEKKQKEKEFMNISNNSDLNDIKYRFRNIIDELKKQRLLDDLEQAKLSYFENTTDSNEKKMHELRRELDDLSYRESPKQAHEQLVEKRFDKWYEENKSRLERKDLDNKFR